MKNIVVADDSRTARMIIRRCLEIAGLGDAACSEAGDGAAALELARKLRPELVLADLNMPSLDGQALLGALKADPALAGIPVIIISSAANAAKAGELRTLGALAVLAKPISPGALGSALKPLLQAG